MKDETKGTLGLFRRRFISFSSGMNFASVIFLPFIVLGLGGGAHRFGPDTDKELVGAMIFLLVVFLVIRRVFRGKD